MVQLQDATIRQHCKALRMPTIGSQFGTLAEQAVREKTTHLAYLEALLTVEMEEREKNTIDRRIKEARLPRVKTIEEFDFSQSPQVTAAKMRDLANGGYIERAEPVLLIGDCGTGKTHLLTGLCVAACRQKRRVRFTTAAALVNELVEAKHQLQLRRVMARWSRYDLSGAFDSSIHHCRFCSAQRLGPAGAVLNAMRFWIEGHQTVKAIELVGFGMMYTCSAR